VFPEDQYTKAFQYKAAAHLVVTCAPREMRASLTTGTLVSLSAPVGERRRERIFAARSPRPSEDGKQETSSAVENFSNH
jgi:hypothetical protein